METTTKTSAIDTSSTGGRDRTWLLVGLLLCGIVGAAVSAYLVQHKLNILYEPGYVSSCNISSSVNCDKVNTSEWSELFGLPISIYGVPLFGLLAWLAASGLMLLKGKKEEYLENLQRRIEFMVGISTGAVLVCLLLAGYSYIVLQTFCLYCISLYVVSITSFILAIVASYRGYFASLGGALRTVGTGGYTFLASFVIVMILSALSLGGYQVAHGYMVDKAKENTKAQFAELKDEPIVFHYDQVNQAAPAPQPGALPAAPGSLPPGQPSVASQAGTANPSAVQAAQVQPAGQAAAAPKGAVPIGVPGGKLSEEGYQFFVTPLDDQDIFYGNPNATVTVVKYADFECAFCKYFAQSMSQVMVKYKDNVRFVMKQFPMNPQCNPTMAGYDKHPNACNAAKASICAGKQGKFWEMHDKLYENAPALSPEDNHKAAADLGLDLAAFDKCVEAPETLARIQSDVAIARRAAISGTPRAYVNGRLLTGSNSGEALEYYIQKALESPQLFVEAQPTQAAPAPAAQGSAPGTMVASARADGTFYIDPYEEAVTKDGKAVSIAGVIPAMVSFDEAQKACAASGKRLCTEEEWVSACAGKPAVDDNSSGWFNDEAIEGNMYPYGAFYAPGTCHDDVEKGQSFPTKTGDHPDCRTASGLYDLPGNLSEWVATKPGKPSLMGGPASGGSGNTCNRRSSTFGSGYRNQTTGFRCCADTAVSPIPASPDQLAQTDLARVGAKLPAFTMETNGKTVSIDQLAGKVVLVTFFASWCGPCKKEFPALVELYKQYNAQGLEIIAIGVDSAAKLSLDFAAGFNATFPVVADEQSNVMGLYGVYSMPATFIADRSGVIQYKSDEFALEVQVQKMQEMVANLLK